MVSLFGGDPLPELNRVNLADCREFLRSMPAHSVQVCVTSPPYWSLRDYLAEGQIGLEKTWEEHVAALIEVFVEVWRVLRPDGTLWLNYGDAWEQKGRKFQWARATGTADGTRWKAGDQMLLPSRLAIALCDAGWWIRSENIWPKLNPSPMPDRGRPTYAHEHIYQLAKCANPYYDIEAVRVAHATQEKRRERIVYQQRSGSKAKSEETSTFRPPHPDGRNLWSYWLMACRACPEAHTATFPEELPETAILASTSEVGCCSGCRAPYKRIKRPTEGYAKRLGKSVHDHSDDLVKGMRGMPKKFNGKKYETAGWAPTCTCQDEGQPLETVPCLVLDPFGGSGTTAAVAERLGRSHLSCELNPEYVDMANRWVEAVRNGRSLKESIVDHKIGQQFLFGGAASRTTPEIESFSSHSSARIACWGNEMEVP